MHVQDLPSPLLEMVLQRMRPDEAADPASGGSHGWPDLQPMPADEAQDAVVCGVIGCCVHSVCLQRVSVPVRQQTRQHVGRWNIITARQRAGQQHGGRWSKR